MARGLKYAAGIKKFIRPTNHDDDNFESLYCIKISTKEMLLSMCVELKIKKVSFQVNARYNQTDFDKTSINSLVSNPRNQLFLLVAC